jgi:hypothetical protein
MKRSELELPEYFDRYINLTDDVTVLEALQTSLSELQTLDLEPLRQLGSWVYAPGKWTINDLIQHIIDTERVFSYRALAFARGERSVQSYDENEYAQQAKAVDRTLEDLLEEAIALRLATLKLFKSFTPEMLQKTGMGFRGPYSVHAIGYILAGHQRWHLEVIRDRYLSVREPKP